MNQVTDTIRKRKDTDTRQAIIRVKIDGKRVQKESKSGFKKKIDAQQRANKRKANRQSKHLSDYDTATIAQLKPLYLDYKKEILRYNSNESKKNAMRLATDFDSYKPSDVTTAMAYEFSKKSPPFYVRYMSSFYNFLINELDMDLKNPFRPIKPERKEKRALSKEEFLDCRKYITKPKYRLGIDIGFYQGLRVSEIAGLTRDCITKDYLLINKQRNHRNLSFGPPKTKNSIRKIPIKKEIYEELMEFKRSQKVMTIDNRVLTDKRYPTNMSHYLIDHFKGTPYEGITPHNFRHSFVTNLIQEGVDPQTVAYLAGDTVTVILKTYTHTNSNTYKIADQAIQSL